MSRRILMNVADGDECRIAVIEDGRLFEYFVDRPSQLKHVGNIYKGQVQNVEPGIQAAFVDIGLERNGFLHVSDVLYAYENNPPLSKLFPRTLRIREAQAGDAAEAEQSILVHGGEQDVEEVDDFVGTGDVPRPEPGSEESTPPAPNGAPAEAAFLEKLSEPQSGHRISESPLQVQPTQPQPMPRTEDSAPEAETDSEPSRPLIGPDGMPVRKKRRRGRRGGRRRREAREGQANGAAPAGDSAGAAPPVAPVAPPESPASASAPETNAPTVAADATPAPADAAAATDANAATAPKPRNRRRRMPKKRGGHLPKRILEQGGAPEEPRPTPGGDGAPPNGPALRFHRGPMPKLQNILKRGQEVVVQVSKASHGGKGPGLTSMISLPGRYMVLTPNSQRGGVSRKIEDGGARNELRKILDKLPVPEGMGVIIRTAAIDRSFEDLNRDLNYLLRLWSVITQRIEEAPAPALLYSDSDPAIRTVRDYFTSETEELVIDDRAVYERVLGFFDQLMPSLRNRVKLYEGDVPLFFAEGVENQIDHIFDKRVPLKSGGYLFVEQTEALVSIDVNSGKFTSAGDAEKTAYLTNMEAIPEICRQLRLRDLAGIVCCDLIDMMSARHRTDVENALRRELRKDKARTKVARMSPFGVIEMTRQRVRPSIKAYTYVGCPTCDGFGMVHSAETMCLSLIRRMKLALGESRVVELAVQVHPHVLSHMHSEFREDIDLLEEQFEKRIVFEYARDLTLGQSRFFYTNDRGVRVVYDMDQRINSFVRSGERSRVNVPLPPSASGAAGTDFGSSGADRRDSRRRRGGRRQRERDAERMQRQKSINTQAQQAVSFGATLPELPPLEIIREAAPAKAEGQGRRDRGRRGRRDDRKGARADKPAATDTPKAEARPAAEPPKAEPAPAATDTPKVEAKPAAKPTRKPAARKAGTGRKPPEKKAPERKPATRKATEKKAPAKATAAKKAPEKKPADKKPAAAKKPAARKPAAKRAPRKGA